MSEQTTPDDEIADLAVAPPGSAANDRQVAPAPGSAVPTPAGAGPAHAVPGPAGPTPAPANAAPGTPAPTMSAPAQSTAEDGSDSTGKPQVAAPQPAKLDPETLAIRARRPRVIRFRREVIITAVALGAALLAGVGWMALRSNLSIQINAENDLSKPNQTPANDALNAMPKNYGDVNKLGPALPGDLGRPFLSAQRERMAVGQGDAQAASQQMDAQRQAAEAQAARQSGLMASTRNTVTAAAAIGTQVSSSSLSPSEAARPVDAMGVSAAPSGQDRKNQFAEKLDPHGGINPHALVAASANTLAAGSVIAASLITGLNSDVPGMVIAQVTQNVYDTATGHVLLIPQGARLVGKYDSAVSYGQQRALVVWQRLMMPDGSSLQLDNMPATDAAGQSGLQDKVNYHTGRLIKGVAVATLLGVATELSISGESELVQAIRESAQTNTARAGDQITQRNLDVQPTITIRPGAPVRLVVRQDLVLKPWPGEGRP